MGLQLLLEAAPELLHDLNMNEDSLLHIACREGRVDCMKYLLTLIDEVDYVQLYNLDCMNAYDVAGLGYVHKKDDAAQTKQEVRNLIHQIFAEKFAFFNTLVLFHRDCAGHLMLEDEVCACVCLCFGCVYLCFLDECIYVYMYI